MAVIADVQAEIVTLQASVAAEANAEVAAETLLTGLNAKYAAAIAALAAAQAGSSTPDPAVAAALAALQALNTTVAGNTTTLSAAVVANTPAQ